LNKKAWQNARLVSELSILCLQNFPNQEKYWVNLTSFDKARIRLYLFWFELIG
jgi:hypothetical protein